MYLEVGVICHQYWSTRCHVLGLFYVSSTKRRMRNIVCHGIMVFLRWKESWEVLHCCPAQSSVSACIEFRLGGFGLWSWEPPAVGQSMMLLNYIQNWGKKFHLTGHSLSPLQENEKLEAGLYFIRKKLVYWL